MLGCLMNGRVEDIAECSGGEIGDFEYDAGIDLGVVVAEDGCGGGIRGCSNGCSGGCEDDSDIDSLCIETLYRTNRSSTSDRINYQEKTNSAGFPREEDEEEEEK
ncbi:Hypothetical predicted protein [Octopus vulgaris]|uniref:Uncharacterized protein n=1 Tax=Octopus vulgaris TaxID=6645 RepID=A0AA36B495_OCTVU|nr:Hypothetical predicted protein [Octopus vulgaris]